MILVEPVNDKVTNSYKAVAFIAVFLCYQSNDGCMRSRIKVFCHVILYLDDHYYSVHSNIRSCDEFDFPV
jgi:hypothetical protein